MAESFAQLPAPTLKIHTWARTIGANTVDEEVQLLGEPYLPSYTAAVNATISTATANSHLLQGMASATVKLRIRRIEIHQHVMATAAAIMGLQIVRLTTAGTGGTGFNSNTLDPADGGVGSGSWQTLPTVKGTEAVAQPVWYGSAYLMQTIAASSQLTNPIAVIDFDKLRSKPLVIAIGAANGFAIKNTTAHAAGAVSITVFFDESSF